MACFYNEIVFDKFRKLAVTELSKLEVGKTYYSNFSGKFVLNELATFRRMWESEGRNGDDCDDTYIQWMLTDIGHLSTHDNNIEASYNPWLIFDNEELCCQCVNELKVTIKNELEFPED